MQTSCSPREHLSSSHYLHDTALIWLENLAFIKYDLLFEAKDGFSVKSELRRHQFWAVLKSTAHSFLHNCLSDQPTISQRWHRNRCKPFVRYTRAAKPYLRNTWIRAASGSSEVTLSPPHLWPEPWPCPVNSRGRRRPRRLEAPWGTGSGGAVGGRFRLNCLAGLAVRTTATKWRQLMAVEARSDCLAGGSRRIESRDREGLRHRAPFGIGLWLKCYVEQEVALRTYVQVFREIREYAKSQGNARNL